MTKKKLKCHRKSIKNIKIFFNDAKKNEVNVFIIEMKFNRKRLLS